MKLFVYLVFGSLSFINDRLYFTLPFSYFQALFSLFKKHEAAKADKKNIACISAEESLCPELRGVYVNVV